MKNKIIALLLLLFFNGLNAQEMELSEEARQFLEENGNSEIPYPDPVSEEEILENPAKKFLEIAIDAIHRNEYERAAKFLQMAMDEGDEDIYWEATIWSYYLRALQGKTDMEDEIKVLEENTRAKAMFFTADGWEFFADRHPERKDILAKSVEMRERLIAIYPDTDWSVRATMQLSVLLLNTQNYERALYYILYYIQYSQKHPENQSLEIDRAWFYLGYILEKSKEHRDLDQALKAYRKVGPGRYYDSAQQRILEIEKFYYMNSYN